MRIILLFCLFLTAIGAICQQGQIEDQKVADRVNSQSQSSLSVVPSILINDIDEKVYVNEHSKESSQSLDYIDPYDPNYIDWNSLTTDSLYAIMAHARDVKDYCLKAKGYYHLAIKDPDFTSNPDKRIEDLELSSIYARKFCKDTVAFYEAKIKYAEFLYANSISGGYTIEEANEALSYFTKKDLPENIIDTYQVLAFLNEKKNEPSKAIDYLIKASDLSIKINDTIGFLKNKPLFNSLTYLIGKPNEAMVLFQDDFKRSCEIPQSDHSVTVDIGLAYAEHLLYSKNYTEALYILNYVESLDIRKNNQTAKLCSLAVIANRNSGYYEKALDYSLKDNNILQSTHNNEAKKRIESSINISQNRELEADLKASEEVNKELEKKNDLSRFWIVFLGLAILASFLALYYISRFYTQKIRVSDLISNQREEINKQRIVKLENNMKIQSLSSMVAGQEAERNRIANDLHDSLGGTLSALKLQFENVVLKNSKTEASKFDNISVLIDGACSEVREIARNLKPASLENIGLEAAVRDLINKYNANTDVEISFNSYVEDIELDYETKLNMYRIIQELLNNVMKHAKATEVDVQLSKSSQELIINVEDNGEGFNINWVKKGLGLDSMQSRVNVLKGDLNIDTAPGRGTSVIVHIPINKMQLS